MGNETHTGEALNNNSVIKAIVITEISSAYGDKNSTSSKQQ
jgi:hypothetical protein